MDTAVSETLTGNLSQLADDTKNNSELWQGSLGAAPSACREGLCSIFFGGLIFLFSKLYSKKKLIVSP